MSVITQRLYKFYGARWGLDALYRDRLKISTHRDINDPFEFLAVGANRNSRRQAKDFRRALFSNHGIISFTKNWAQPLLWSHYADNHTGLALGFDIPEQNCFAVKYQDDRVVLPESNSENYVLGERYQFHSDIKVVKSKHWSYEDEVRIFPPIQGSIYENEIYFWKISDLGTLREVVLGPL